MGDTLVIEGNTCKILSSIDVKGENYIYVAKIEEDDITGDFFVYKKNVFMNTYEKIQEPEELKKILLLVTADMI